MENNFREKHRKTHYENADKKLICKYELTGYGKEKVKQHICLSHGGKNA